MTVLAGVHPVLGARLSQRKIFDEAYYPVEAQEMLRFGYEDNRGYMFIVHPPLGQVADRRGVGDLFGNNCTASAGASCPGAVRLSDRAAAWRASPAG